MQVNEDRIWNLIARKLSGEASLEELQELELLLQKSPEQNYSMEVLMDLWQSNTDTDSTYAENKYQGLVLKMQQSGTDDGLFETGDSIKSVAAPTTNSRRPMWIAGIALLVLSGIAALLLQYYSPAETTLAAGKQPAMLEVKTKNGYKTNMVLPDGTKVWLNAGSEMTYSRNYGETVREVKLTGEAYFDVVKNTGKPFIIHAGNMQIKVLGTAFNVRCYPDENNSETSLVRGSLEVTLDGNDSKYVLKSNEKLVVAKADFRKGSKKNPQAGIPVKALEQPGIVLSPLQVMPQDNTIAETSWVNNKLVFRSESFEEVARKMERWYGVHITIKEDRIKKKIFTGIFENETVEQALEAMQYTTPFSYSANADHITITK